MTPGDTAPTLRQLDRRFTALTALRWLPSGLSVPTMVLLMQERGLDVRTVGILLAVLAAAIIVLELPSGGFADVVGRRNSLLICGSLSALAALGFALSPGIGAFAVTILVHAVAKALDSGPLKAWYVDAAQSLDPDVDLTPGFARAATAESLGLGAGALLAGGLVTIAPLPAAEGPILALSVPYLAGSCLTLLSLGLVARWVHDPPRQRGLVVREIVTREVPATMARGVRLAVTRGPLRSIALYMIAFGVALSGVELLAPTAFAGFFGGGSAASGFYSVLVTAGFAGSALGASLAPRVAQLVRGSRRGAGLATAVAALGISGLAVPLVGFAAAGYFLVFLLLGIASPLVDEATQRATPSDQRATVGSVMSLAMQSGGVLANVVCGALAASVALPMGVGVIALGLVFGALAIGIGTDRRTEPSVEPEVGDPVAAGQPAGHA